MFAKHDDQTKKRIPPGQFLTPRFPVLHYGPIPKVDLESWTFRVWGEVEKPLALSWEEFSALPKTRLTMDVHCVTKWSKLDTSWEGVSLQTLKELGLVVPTDSARFVIQHAEYGYSANLPLDLITADNFLLATHYEDEPITLEHGAPLRGICGAIPGRRDLKDVYFWKGAKWLRGLEFSASDQPGFWERAGYHNEGDVWLEQRLER
ncbi:MAG: sulfite oxidase-like oxidoreductase [Anaerolineaceae bacterium]|nr:sulfite oxidase-like oxidoreductase [Anaerolineaceae bacterium]